MNLQAIALFVATAAPEAEAPEAADPAPAAVEPARPDALLPDPTPAPAPVPVVDPFRPPSAVLCEPPDPAEPPEARQARANEAIGRADALFREEKYGDALVQLDLAACHAAHRDYDFMRGAVHQRRGDCPAAIRAYERFLAQAPPQQDAEAARAQISICEEASEAWLPVLPPAPSRYEPSPAPPPADAPPPPPPKHWSRDIAGGVMLGVGLVGMGVGTGLRVAGGRDGSSPASYDEFIAEQDRLRRLRVAGTTAIAVSSVTIAAAIIRYAVVARKGARGRRDLASR